MYYYGARYYDPRLSIFISVDPLAEEFPNYGGYVYTMNNPIRYTDPTGMAPEDIINFNVDTGNIEIIENEEDDIVRFVNNNGKELHQYKYGEDGSFNEDFDLHKAKFVNGETKTSDDVTYLTSFENNDKVDELFLKIVDYSNVEFEKVALKFKNKNYYLLATTGDSSTVTYFGSTANSCKKRGFHLFSHSHNHPSGTSFPSGHNDEGIPQNNQGDVGFARNMRLLFGDKVNFYLYPKGKNSVYKYDDKNKTQKFIK